MKRSLLPVFWFSLYLVALILLVSCNNRKGKPSPVKNKKTVVVKSVPCKNTERESITFILGEDKSPVNPYYTEATKYYRNNPSAKTTWLDTTCRSLLEVRNYLETHSPSNKLPWGLINLVSHGDRWFGLSVKITPNSKRTTLERLQEYIQNGTFMPLPDPIIDQQSEIAIHACSVGNIPELIETIGLIFKSQNSIPGIRAPRLQEFYATDTNIEGKPENKLYLAQGWIITYKKEEQPGNTTICNLLHEKYPDSDMDWQDALTRDRARFGGDTYHYTFNIPVNLVINCSDKDSLPDLSISEKKLAWINHQPEIMDELNKIQIPAENFSWDLKKGYAKNKAGKRTPAILIKGYCTVLCVLKPLIDKNNSTAGNLAPLIPEITDSCYYYAIKGNRCMAQN
jgi:hypothetical protein